MGEQNHQSVLEKKCGFKGVLTREECVKCPGYNPQCPDVIDNDAPEQEIIDRYRNIKK